MLVAAISLILMCQVTRSYAQEPTPSASAATPAVSPSPTPSDTEIKKTLVRALDKVEAQDKTIRAKDDVIAEQDNAVQQNAKAAEMYKLAAEKYKDAFVKEAAATETAEKAWADERERTRKLEKKVRSANSRTKYGTVAGILIGAVGALLLTR